MVHNFNRYLSEMEKMGYVNNYEVLDARDFGLPQARERVFTISCLDRKFDFDKLDKKPMQDIKTFLENNVAKHYTVTQPSMLSRIEKKSKNFSGVIPVIREYAMTITTKQMRCPNSGVVDLGNGQYRYLTERECWRLQGYSDEDFENALLANPCREGKMNGALYKQAGNSIAVPIFESIFEQIIKDLGCS